MIEQLEKAVVDSMLGEMQKEGELFLPSKFWLDLNKKNEAMLGAEGLNNFKRTLAQNYFNFFLSDKESALFAHAYNEWRKKPNVLPYITSLKETERLRFTTQEGRAELTPKQRELYRKYVCYVWTIMQRLDKHGLRHRVSEPIVGSPFPVKFGLKLLSQDLANSILECNHIADLSAGVANPKIAEVGAGYGRVAYVYAKTLPGQYFIFDIPPALAVSQWYLTNTIGEKVFKFRPFDRFEDIEAELASCKVGFFTPNQIKKFPDRFFDVTLSISTFPEMRMDQVDFYLGQFQRLSRGGIFIKQHKQWKNPEDGTDLSVDDYQLAPEWKVVSNFSDPVIYLFFNRCWRRT